MKLLMLSSLLFAGCATAPLVAADIPSFASVPIDGFKYNGPADLQFTIDGIGYIGTATVPHKVPRTFKFNILKNTERLVIRTCHRSIKFDNPPAGQFEWLYQPRFKLEDAGLCLMFVDAITKEGVLKSAQIDFTDKENMIAFSSCNGITVESKGASLCQAPIGLLQMLQVSEDVDVVNKDGCQPIKCTGIWCYYIMSANDCWYAIRGLKTGTRHRLITRGYKETN
jgi:hypothetical protein